ncbi:MAG: DinB family protein [Dehalococcoidia bacterium]|nr:MAG: DinB family protein [Dehalococcoidia bacterium]
MAAAREIDGVIELIRENRRRFEEFCYSLSEEELMRPVPGTTWVVRDFAAHIDTLDTALWAWIQGAPPASQATAAAPAAPGNGSNGGVSEEFDVDAFNDAQVAERRSWPLDRIFAEAAANRARLIEAMSTLTDERMAGPMHFPGDHKRQPADLPLRLFLAGWAQHDAMHVADMIKALPERADDPKLKHWLDNPFVTGYQAVMSGPEPA